MEIFCFLATNLLFIYIFRFETKYPTVFVILVKMSTYKPTQCSDKSLLKNNH